MNIVLDLAVVAIVVLLVYGGYRRGVIKTVAELICNVVSSVLASAVGSIISVGLYENYVKGFIIDTIKNSLPEFTAATRTSDVIKGIMTESPEYVRNVLEMQNIDAEAINRDIIQAGTDIPATLESMVRPVILKVFTVLVTIILFIIIVSVAALISKALTKTVDTVGLGTVNKIFGGILGLIEAVVILAMISLIIYILTVMLPTDLAQGLRDAIDSTFIYKIIFYIDFPDTIITNMLNL